MKNPYGNLVSNNHSELEHLEESADSTRVKIQTLHKEISKVKQIAVCDIIQICIFILKERNNKKYTI